MAQLPLFPLNTVLFPGGQMHLRIFEPRYLEMSKACLRDDSVFGVCPIRDGFEAGTPAAPFNVGCTARIVDVNVTTPGLLSLVIRGEQVFEFDAYAIAPSGLLRADVTLRPPLSAAEIPCEFTRLSRLLKVLIDKIGSNHFSEPLLLGDAGWVAGRLAELLPLEREEKVRLLGVGHPIDLLGEINRSVVIESA